MHERPKKISKLSSAGTVRFSTAMSWLPVPRKPFTDQVSRICASTARTSSRALLPSPESRRHGEFRFP